MLKKSAKKLAKPTPNLSKNQSRLDAYVENVRNALDDDDSRALSKEEYQEALQEIFADVEARLSAVTDELEA